MAGLDAASLRRPVGDGTWNVGQTLAHLAFWDRLMAARWEAAAGAGLSQPVPIPGAVADLLNDSLAPAWRILSEGDPKALFTEVVAATSAVDSIIDGLPDQTFAITGLNERVVDRSLHRTEHADQIDAALR